MDLESRATAIINGEDPPADDLKVVADSLRDAGQTALVARMLIAMGRRALKDATLRPDRSTLAWVLRDHQQFGYARRLLARIRAEPSADTEQLRQQEALCTYKDLELPARRRLDRALRILTEGGPLDASTSAETLGIAGAIHKRRWDVDGKQADLENALFCYRRGFAQVGDPERWYTGVNAAFVADRLAELEAETLGGAARATALREEADAMREAVAGGVLTGDCDWGDATYGEALFGLGRFAEARAAFERVASRPQHLWRRETTATQLGELARLRGFAGDEAAHDALAALFGGERRAVGRASIGKVGVALSGGGFRASLFHIGVLARLAECRVLRHVEVLSCVSGGSILGAYFYLKLKALLERKADNEIGDVDYVSLVRELADEFLDGVRTNVRGSLAANPGDDARMAFTRYSRTDRIGELFEDTFYGRLHPRSGPWRLPELVVKPAGAGENFSLRYENWRRQSKVPVLVLNATTLNTGHAWQFTPTEMGEPPAATDEPVDASQRLRRNLYASAPRADLRAPTLGKAVAASACVPGLFPPITLRRLFDGIDVELVDGGVHDNQGIASLVEQDCAVILASDASGQLADDEDPKRWFPRVLKRSNSILMKRVRGAQYDELLGRVRAGSLRGFMAVHLTKGLRATPRDWSGVAEPWDPVDDALAGQPAPYGIDPVVQRLLAELRTDLDVFTDDEAYALMAAGYLMVRQDLHDALPQLSVADPALEGADWPFCDMLAEMTSSDTARLVDALREGDILFFRHPRAWLRRRRVSLASNVRKVAGKLHFGMGR